MGAQGARTHHAHTDTDTTHTDTDNTATQHSDTDINTQISTHTDIGTPTATATATATQTLRTQANGLSAHSAHSQVKSHEHRRGAHQRALRAVSRYTLAYTTTGSAKSQPATTQGRVQGQSQLAGDNVRVFSRLALNARARCTPPHTSPAALVPACKACPCERSTRASEGPARASTPTSAQPRSTETLPRRARQHTRATVNTPQPLRSYPEWWRPRRARRVCRRDARQHRRQNVGRTNCAGASRRAHAARCTTVLRFRSAHTAQYVLAPRHQHWPRTSVHDDQLVCVRGDLPLEGVFAGAARRESCYRRSPALVFAGPSVLPFAKPSPPLSVCERGATS